ncbi:MAG: hypothetical protein ABUJ98_13825 [Hyphomicrobium sp.]
MKCDDCKNYEPKGTGWTDCRVAANDTYSNDGDAGPDDPWFPRLKWFVRGCRNGICQTRAGFQTQADAELFLAALPEEER